MLIPSDRHRPDDLALWAELEEADRIHGERPALARRVERSLDAICDFVACSPAYAGLSWGKDSTVLAHLLWRCIPRLKDAIPAYWVHVRPIANPDCFRVSSAFLDRWYLDYHRIDVDCHRDLLGWHATGTLEAGFAEVIRHSGTDRHISGVRGEESGERLRRMRRWGISTARTCAPLGWWTATDIYAYMAIHNLPVHPAYAMMGGGRWPRERLRVASLGGRRGDGMGRREWETEYYGDVIRRLEAGV